MPMRNRLKTRNSINTELTYFTIGIVYLQYSVKKVFYIKFSSLVKYKNGLRNLIKTDYRQVQFLGLFQNQFQPFGFHMDMPGV